MRRRLDLREILAGYGQSVTCFGKES
jgi:hypothetical protein